MSAGERMPSSKRFSVAVVSVVLELSEEFDFVIGAFGFGCCFLGSSRFLRRLKFFYYWFAGAIASNDFDFLLGACKAFLANLYQVHAFLITLDQIFERQFTRLHLLDNFLEAIHRAFEVKLCLPRPRFTAHGENGRIKHSLATKKGRLTEGFSLVTSAEAARLHCKITTRLG
jgi:hypothetical protein